MLIQNFDVLLCISTHYNLLSVFLILINISAFVEKFPHKHLWETGGCFRKLKTKSLRWIYLKHPDKYNRCTSVLWIPCRPHAVWANEHAVLLRHQRKYLYLCYRCLLLLYKSARVEGHSRVNSNSSKNCMLWPSNTLNKSLPAIVMYKSLILSDSIHLDHNLSIPIGSSRRFCLLITQSTTF